MSAGNLFEFAGTAPCSFEAWVDPVLDGYYHNVLSRSDGQGGSTMGYLMYLEPRGRGAHGLRSLRRIDVEHRRVEYAHRDGELTGAEAVIDWVRTIVLRKLVAVFVTLVEIESVGVLDVKLAVRLPQALEGQLGELEPAGLSSAVSGASRSRSRTKTPQR